MYLAVSLRVSVNSTENQHLSSALHFIRQKSSILKIGLFFSVDMERVLTIVPTANNPTAIDSTINTVRNLLFHKFFSY